MPPPIPALADQKRDRHGLAVLLIMVGISMLATMDAVAKLIGEGYHVGQIVFFRALVGQIPVFIIIAVQGQWARVRTHRPMAHLLRGLTWVMSIGSFFWAIQLIPLADATAIFFVSPLIATALSVPLLGETVGWRRWTAVIVGFIGAMIVIRPGSGVFGWAAMLPLIGAFSYSVLTLTGRRMVMHEDSTTVSLWVSASPLLIFGAMLPFVWITPVGTDWLLFIGLGLLGGTGNFLVTLAFRYASVSLLVPFEYVAMLLAVIYGWAIWQEVPDEWVFVGAAIICGSGLFVALREARMKEG